MDKQQQLHTRRLQESLEQIPQLRETTAEDSAFQSWKDRTQRSLNALFGEDHHYANDFSRLSFRVLRLHGPRWNTTDQQLYEKGLERAERLLSDAIEEVEAVPDAFLAPDPSQMSAPSDASPVFKLVLQQTQSVQQIQTLSFDQVIEAVNDLGLPDKEAEEARELAEEFRQEAEGEGSWSRIGEILQQMKGLGATVLHRVGIPLLLEWIKHETGMSPSV